MQTGEITDRLEKQMRVEQVSVSVGIRRVIWIGEWKLAEEKVCEIWKKACTRSPGAEEMSLWLSGELMGEGRRQRIEKQVEFHQGGSWLQHGQQQHLV